MILRKLKLENFRQFLGPHEIEFATDAARNVTLVIGYNTFGKSTLLNAINFALFGEVQPDFDEPDRLLNYEAEKSAKNTVSVSLEFEFQGNKYVVERKRNFVFHGGGRVGKNDEATLSLINPKTGSWDPVPSYQQLINRAIPKEMAPHFIFHGEKRVNSYRTSGTKREVGKAIRQILGCHLIETSLADLQVIEKKLEAAAANASGKEEVAALQRTLESLEKIDKDLDEKIQSHEDKIEAADAEIKKLEEQLRDHDRTKEIQELQSRAKEKLKTSERTRDDLQQQVWRWVKESAINVVSAAVTTASLDAIDEEEYRGKIPSDYQESFILDLLKREKCICTADLKPGSQASNAVHALLASGGKREVIDAALKVKSSAERMNRSIRKSKDELARLQKQLRSVEHDIAVCEQDIKEYDTRLTGVDVDELREKALTKQRLDKEIKRLSMEIGDLRRKKNVEIRDHIREKKAEIDKMTRGLPEVEKKKRILEVTQTLILYLQQQLERYESEARVKLLDLTNQNITVMHRAKEAFFDEKFNLGLRDKDTKIIGGKSTGEAQLLVLSFTSALIQFCSQRERDKNQFLTPGTVAPLILDAPFGQLDSAFQEAAISWIPSMAKQVILFVSDTQGNLLLGNEEAMDKVGVCYVIQLAGDTTGLRTYKVKGTEYPNKVASDSKTTLAKRIW